MEHQRPSIATIDASGRVTASATGTSASSPLINTERRPGAGWSTFTVAAAWGRRRLFDGRRDHFAKAAADAIDNPIADADPQTDMAIFTTQDHANGIYVRNPNCWAADLDLTGVSPWNSRSGALRAGVAISPRDVLTSEHYPLQVGDTILSRRTTLSSREPLQRSKT